MNSDTSTTPNTTTPASSMLPPPPPLPPSALAPPPPLPPTSAPPMNDAASFRSNFSVRPVYKMLNDTTLLPSGSFMTQTGDSAMMGPQAAPCLPQPPPMSSAASSGPVGARPREVDPDDSRILPVPIRMGDGVHSECHSQIGDPEEEDGEDECEHVSVGGGDEGAATDQVKMPRLEPDFPGALDALDQSASQAVKFMPIRRGRLSRWVQNFASKVCMACGKPFTRKGWTRYTDYFRALVPGTIRQLVTPDVIHHCRECGYLICHDCTRKVVLCARDGRPVANNMFSELRVAASTMAGQEQYVCVECKWTHYEKLSVREEYVAWPLEQILEKQKALLASPSPELKSLLGVRYALSKYFTIVRSLPGQQLSEQELKFLSSCADSNVIAGHPRWIAVLMRYAKTEEEWQACGRLLQTPPRFKCQDLMCVSDHCRYKNEEGVEVGDSLSAQQVVDVICTSAARSVGTVATDLANLLDAALEGPHPSMSTRELSCVLPRLVKAMCGYWELTSKIHELLVKWAEKDDEVLYAYLHALMTDQKSFNDQWMRVQAIEARKTQIIFQGLAGGHDSGAGSGAAGPAEAASLSSAHLQQPPAANDAPPQPFAQLLPPPPPSGMYPLPPPPSDSFQQPPAPGTRPSARSTPSPHGVSMRSSVHGYTESAKIAQRCQEARRLSPQDAEALRGCCPMRLPWPPFHIVVDVDTTGFKVFSSAAKPVRIRYIIASPEGAPKSSTIAESINAKKVFSSFLSSDTRSVSSVSSANADREKPPTADVLYKFECGETERTALDIFRLAHTIMCRERQPDDILGDFPRDVKLYSAYPLRWRKEAGRWGDDWMFCTMIEMIDSTPYAAVKDKLIDHLIGPLGRDIEKRRLQQGWLFYGVMGYLMGVGDRHYENIMVTPDFHWVDIDFGWVMGKSSGLLGSGMYSPPLRCTVDIQKLWLGYWWLAKKYCWDMLRQMRRYSNLFTIMQLGFVDSGYMNVSPNDVFRLVEDRFATLSGPDIAQINLFEALYASDPTILSQFANSWHQFKNNTAPAAIQWVQATVQSHGRTAGGAGGTAGGVEF